MAHPAPSYLSSRIISESHGRGETGAESRHSKSPPAAPPPVPLLRRLNGRPQACDPCRSRKVACDNAQPVCQRCEKRNQVSRCVYTISDQTSQAGLPSSAGRRARQSSSRDARSGSKTPSRARGSRAAHHRESTSRSSDSQAAETRTRQASQMNHQSTPAPPTPPERPTPRTRTSLPFGEGYLGFISYSNVFDEARNTLSLLNSGFPQVPQQGGTPNTNNSRSNHQTPASQHLNPSDSDDPLLPATRGVCLHVLRSLPDPSYPNLGTPGGHQAAQLWVRVCASRIMSTLRRRYGSVLGPNRTEAKLERMAREICANSAKPFDSDLADPEAFLNQFAGDDLRWESLGLLFTFRQYAPDVNGSGAVPPPAARESKGMHQLWSEPSRQCLRLCLVLAKAFSDGNTISMYLCIRQMVVDSLVYGDASLDCWLSHGAASAVATFLGLHALPDPPNYKPSLASELKRRFFANIFTLDKVGASFHGRPPLLGHRYAVSPPPLDIRDEALLAGGEALERAVAGLDEKGWARDGVMDSVTLMRCRMMIAAIKDELMEIALGSMKNASIAVITEIKQREQRTFDSFPLWCKYKDEHLDDDDLSTDVLFCRLLLDLEHLQACLIAERMIARHSGPDDGSLLFISFEMLRRVLVLWMHVDRFEGGWGGARVDFLWMVMSFGAPAGGVLCMELLFPTLPNRPIPYTSASSPRVTRSAIIQQLSLLVGFLGWVAPSAPNSEHPVNCRRVIQSVLDYTLNNSIVVSSGSNAPVAPGGQQYQQQVVDGIGLFEGLDAGALNIGFDMLGTFDWFRTEEAMPGFN